MTAKDNRQTGFIGVSGLTIALFALLISSLMSATNGMLFKSSLVGISFMAFFFFFTIFYYYFLSNDYLLTKKIKIINILDLYLESKGKRLSDRNNV